MYKPTLAVDFDQTLCESNYPGFGPMKPGARDALIRFKQLGYHILIYTCRTCSWHEDIFGTHPCESSLDRDHVVAMIEWLKANGIPFDEVDDGTKGKPLAEYYIDDRAIRFDNNWDEIATFVELNQGVPA